MANVINGGAHSDAPIDFQEFMIVPKGFDTFSEGLRAITETFHALKAVLEEEGPLHRRRRRRRVRAQAGEHRGGDRGHPAGHQGRRLQGGQADLPRAGCRRLRVLQRQRHLHLQEEHGKTVDRRRELIEFYVKLCGKYPIISIEDGCAESDWTNWKKLTDKLGDKIQLVGDDLFVTNVKFLQRGIDTGTANSILVKVNQIGSLTETLDAVELAQDNGYTAVISHRSGETEDATIADIAVATNAGQIKTGSLSRTDRVAKYNQLLRIEQLARQERGLRRQVLAALLNRRRVLLGSTGDPPEPVGDSPTGTEVGGRYRDATALPKGGLDFPPGQWPGGTGESPVLPSGDGSRSLKCER
jgi:enolase